MKPIRLLFSATDNTVSAIQDSFGSEYRCTRRPMVPGQIGEIEIDHSTNPHRATSENGRTIHRYSVIRPVDANTVRALLRRSDYATRPLAKGYWYEVISE
jgi:hypothetical protein